MFRSYLLSLVSAESLASLFEHKSQVRRSKLDDSKEHLVYRGVLEREAAAKLGDRLCTWLTQRLCPSSSGGPNMILQAWEYLWRVKKSRSLFV